MYATAEGILENVNKCIKELEDAVPHANEERIKTQSRYYRNSIWKNGKLIKHDFRYCFKIVSVYKELSIFDWWNEHLSMSQLKDMQKFLKTAIELGYTGYVCFKVGATGCANGMWAHKKESTDGYSPDGETLYKSFTPDYNYWSFCDAENKWFPDREHYNSIKTIKQLKKAKEEMYGKA